MSKQVLIIGAVVGGLVLLVVLAMFLVALTAPQAPAQQGTDIYTQNTVTVTPPDTNQTIQYLATSSKPAASMEVGLTTGKSIVVNDFVHAKTTVTDPNIPNRYFLAGGIDPVGSDQPYSIYYSSVDQSFTVVLLKSPFSVVRDEAELDLITKLGIDKTTACDLRFQVVIPTWQSAQYGGENLGFSGCSNSVNLTE